MQPQHRGHPSSFPLLWWIGASAFIGGLLSVPLFWGDLAVTAWCMEVSRGSGLLLWWNDVAARSLFEGGPPGAQDVSYAVIILLFVAYACAMVPRWRSRAAGFRLFAGYCLGCMLLFFIANRGLKAFFGRARPVDVLGGEQVYSSIWLIGPYGFSEALSKGSFTSGHTTTAMFLVPMALYLWHASRRCIAWPVLLLALVWAAVVGAGRIFHGSHYPGDVLWAMIVCLWISAYAAFHLFNLNRRDRTPSTPWYREIRLTIWASLTFLAFFCVAIGLKQMIFQPAWYWPLVTCLSALITWAGSIRTTILARC